MQEKTAFLSKLNEVDGLLSNLIRVQEAYIKAVRAQIKETSRLLSDLNSNLLEFKKRRLTPQITLITDLVLSLTDLDRI